MLNTPKQVHSQRGTENGSKDDTTQGQAVAYPGPIKEVTGVLNSHNCAKPQQNQVTIEDVVTGFLELGKT